jgi:hypothetical protein
MVKDECQYYAARRCCHETAAFRLFDGTEPVGRVCPKHERIMRRKFPEMTSIPIRRKRPA